MSSNWSKIVDKFGGVKLNIRHDFKPFTRGRIYAKLDFYLGESPVHFSGEGPTVVAALDALDRDIVCSTLTLDQAAKREGIHRNTVLAWLDRGWLCGFKGVCNSRSMWFVFPGGVE